MRDRLPKVFLDIIVALALTAGAVGARLAIAPWLGDRVPFATFFAAVAAASWFAGLRSALTTALLGYLVADALFTPPDGRIASLSLPALVTGVAYWAVCALVIVLTGAARRAEQARAAVLAGIRDQFFILDRRWRYTFVNARVEEMTGRSASRLLGREIWREFPHLRGSSFEREVRRVAESRQPTHFEIYYEPLGRWFENHVYPTDDGVAFFVTDVTERKKVEHRLRASEAQHRALAANFPGGAAFVVDRDLRYLLAEGDALRAAGYQPSDFEGRTVQEVCPPDILDEYVAHYHNALAGATFTHEHRNKGRCFLTRGTPLRDDAGDIVAALAVTVDITEHKRTEEALRTNEQRARLALEVARLGTWSFDPLTGVVTADARAREICGISPDEPLNYPGLRIHPDDRNRVAAAMGAALDPQGDGSYAQELRFVSADGTVRHVLSRAQTLFDPPEPGAPGRKPVLQLGTSLDITPHREAEARLLEADRRKDEFIALLGHELRNPLGPILHAARILATEPNLPPAAQHARDIVARQSAHMARLVDDLLDISRITNGKLHLTREPQDFSRLTRLAVEDYRPLFQGVPLDLRAQLPVEPLWVEGDAERLSQIIGNVLSNARKFTEPGGRVEVELSAAPGEARLVVRDTGIGMDEASLRTIFEPFTQADQSLARSRGGLGLGLALARLLLEMHRGTITAESAGRDRGATFTIRIPLCPAPHSDPAQAMNAPPPSPRRTVLVIDDHRDTAESLGMLLRHSGHTVHLAHSGPEGVATARTHRPEVIFCDIGLPEMDGFAVARALRSDAALANSRLIALSGYAMDEDRKASRAAGFDLHLAKPIDFAALEGVLNGPS